MNHRAQSPLSAWIARIMLVSAVPCLTTLTPVFAQSEGSVLAGCLAMQAELGERPDDEELAARVSDCADTLAADRLVDLEEVGGESTDSGADSASAPNAAAVSGAVAAVGELATREEAEDRLEGVILGDDGGEVQIELQNPDNPLNAGLREVPPHGEGERRPRW